MSRSVIQKFRPSLHAPAGQVAAPVEKVPSGVRSAAFHNETLLPKLVRDQNTFAIEGGGDRNIQPIACKGCQNEGVARGLPTASLTRTTVTESELRFGTQMFVPSKTGILGLSAHIDRLRDAAI